MAENVEKNKEEVVNNVTEPVVESVNLESNVSENVEVNPSLKENKETKSKTAQKTVTPSDATVTVSDTGSSSNVVVTNSTNTVALSTDIATDGSKYQVGETVVIPAKYGPEEEFTITNKELKWVYNVSSATKRDFHVSEVHLQKNVENPHHVVEKNIKASFESTLNRE